MTFWTFLTILLCVGVFIVFPRLLFYVVSLIVIGVLLYFMNQSRKKSIHEAIKITIKYDLQNCSEEYPLVAVIKNDSKKVVHKVEWTIMAYKPGYSNNIADFMHPKVYKILKKGDTYRVCCKLPNFVEPFPPKQAIYDVDYKHIKLADGEDIYQSDAR